MTDSPGPAAPAPLDPPTDIETLAFRISECVANEVMCPEHGYAGPSAPIAVRVADMIRSFLLMTRGAVQAERPRAPDAVSDALALIRRALAMRDYGDKPDIWDQVWRDVEDAARRLGNALAVGSERALQGAPNEETPIQELAQAAQSYLNSQEMVGHDDESRRRLRQRLGELIGPHLIAQCERRDSLGGDRK